MSTNNWLDTLRAAAMDAMAAVAAPSSRRTKGGSGAHLGTNPPDSYHLAALVAHLVLLEHVSLPQIASAVPTAAHSVGNVAAAVPSA